MGTFAYASPEQVSGNPDLVDTRTDVYALGVILYEMILGQRPYRVTGSIAQMVKSIVDEPPVSPRQIDPGISQDIETILLRSLDKETDRRYQSPAAIASDIRHWLNGEAIEARRDDGWYVARKFLRRHWLPVSGVAAAADIDGLRRLHDDTLGTSGPLQSNVGSNAGQRDAAARQHGPRESGSTDVGRQHVGSDGTLVRHHQRQPVRIPGALRPTQHESGVELHQHRRIRRRQKRTASITRYAREGGPVGIPRCGLDTS